MLRATRVRRQWSVMQYITDSLVLYRFYEYRGLVGNLKKKTTKNELKKRDQVHTKCHNV